jgi:hypothetical protein
VRGKAADAPRPPVRIEQVRACKTPAEVRRLLGAPAHVARQIFSQCYLEQWIYEKPLACRVEFICRLGKEVQIQSVHPITSDKP